MNEEESFVHLEIPTINCTEGRVHKNYIIYTNEHDYVTVEAATAHEALEKEKIIAPYKIIIPTDRNKFIINHFKKPMNKSDI